MNAQPLMKTGPSAPNGPPVPIKIAVPADLLRPVACDEPDDPPTADRHEHSPVAGRGSREEKR